MSVGRSRTGYSMRCRDSSHLAPRDAYRLVERDDYYRGVPVVKRRVTVDHCNDPEALRLQRQKDGETLRLFTATPLPSSCQNLWRCRQDACTTMVRCHPSPNMARPMRTTLAPSSMATSKSLVIPMESTLQWSRPIPSLFIS